jgi:hypothetical protein
VMGDGNSSETKNTEVDNQNPDIDPGENDFRFTGTSRHVMLIVATGPHTFLYVYVLKMFGTHSVPKTRL